MKVFICLLTVLLLLAACATTEPGNAQLTGAQMYERLCSSCHGPAGHGDGPVSSLIKTGVPDLTRLALHEGGEFPTEDVRRTIDGRWDRRAHGARDMPVWGWRLYDSANSTDVQERAIVDSMIGRLVDHLRSIQVEK